MIKTKRASQHSGIKLTRLAPIFFLDKGKRALCGLLFTVTSEGQWNRDKLFSSRAFKGTASSSENQIHDTTLADKLISSIDFRTDATVMELELPFYYPFV